LTQKYDKVLIVINRKSKVDENIDIDKDTLDWIRSLSDFDLTMLLSEVSDYGWERSLPTIEDMKKALGD